uniref:Uncharacterized protein n=1 Tax=viral metagenome TaxID=1070528 RepID=A0A6M3LUT3_9ZZZZ
MKDAMERVWYRSRTRVRDCTGDFYWGPVRNRIGDRVDFPVTLRVGCSIWDHVWDRVRDDAVKR